MSNPYADPLDGPTKLSPVASLLSAASNNLKDLPDFPGLPGSGISNSCTAMPATVSTGISLADQDRVPPPGDHVEIEAAFVVDMVSLQLVRAGRIGWLSRFCRHLKSHL